MILSQQRCKISTYSGLWNCVIRQIVSSVLDYHSSFIFRVRSPRILLEMLELEDEGTIILRNAGNYPPNVTASHPKWYSSPITLQLLFKKWRRENIYLYLYNFTGLAANYTSQFRAFNTDRININRLHYLIKEFKLLNRVIHKSLRDFRIRLRNNQDRHGRKEHIKR